MSQLDQHLKYRKNKIKGLVPLFLSFLHLTSCSDPPKPHLILLQHLRQSPAAVQPYIQSFSNPIERDYILLEAVEAYPNQTEELCREITSQYGRERCLRITHRPHLWQNKVSLNITVPLPSPSNRHCNLDPHPTTCWTALAVQELERESDQAKSDQFASVLSSSNACLEITEPLWQAECFFTLAETLPTTRDILPKRLEFCRHAHPFQTECWRHVVIESAQTLSSEQPTANDVLQYTQTIEEAMDDEASVASRPPLLSLFQAQMARRHWEEQRESLEVLQSTHPEWTVYYRNILAVEALRWCDAPLQDIQHWQTIAETWTGQETTACPKLLSKPRGLDLQVPMATAQTEYPNCTFIDFFEYNQRLSCSDERIDWQLVLVYASARLRPSQLTLLQEVQQSNSQILETYAKHIENEALTLLP